MPEAGVLFIFGLLLQAFAAVASAEPTFLKERQIELANGLSSTSALNSAHEQWIRTLVQHQLVGHIRSFYGWLLVLRYGQWFLVILAGVSGLAYHFLGNADITIAVWVFVLIFLGFGVLVSIPSLFCLLLSVLLTKTIPT